MLFGEHGSTVNGPVPTGFGSSQVSGWAAPAPVEKMCFGTMPTWLAKLKKYGPAGWLNLIVTCLPLAVTLVSPAPVHSAYRSVDGTFFIRLNVYSTSAALNGCPSFHVTPSRTVKTIDFLSGVHWYDDASIGVSFWSCSRLTNTSGSYTKPRDVVLTAGLNGLKWQVQVCPCTFAIVKVPPCLCDAFSVLLGSLPVLPVSLDVVVDPPLQAASSRPTAAAAARVRVRLILTVPS